MNRLSLTLGLAAMDACWVSPWALLFGIWSDSSSARGLLSPASVFVLVLMGALTTQAFGRRAASSRAARLAVVGLGLLLVALAVRLDQYPSLGGLEWVGWLIRALAVLLGQASGPALAFALGVFLWWRGVRIGSQMPGYSDVEGAFRWGIGLLVAFALVSALTTRPSLLPRLEAETTPFVVGFFFVSLVTLALARLESLRTRTRALALNTQWVGVLIVVAGAVVLVALVIGQLLSFDLLMLATRPVFDLLGQVLLLVVYAIVIPLVYVVELLLYLLLRLLRPLTAQTPPQPPQPSDIDNLLSRVLSQQISPEVLVALKALGAILLAVAALVLVARAVARWRPASTDADATDEERETLWEPGALKRALLAWLRRLFRRGRLAATALKNGGADGAQPNVSTPLSTVREVYRQVLRLGDSAGARRSPASTPFEHLPALQASLDPADGLATLTDAYVQVRYAEQEPPPNELESIHNQLDQLRPRAPAPDGPPDGA